MMTSMPSHDGMMDRAFGNGPHEDATFLQQLVTRLTLDDYGGEEYQGNARQPLNRANNVTECVAVPSSEHVAEIVGRQGCKIKALRAKTSTYIKTPVRGDDPVFVVTGRREDVLMAKREILAAAEHFSQIRASRSKSSSLGQNGSYNGSPSSTLGENQVTIQVRVPYRVVGLVVGPKGATVKRIQQMTNTYIVTPSRDKEPCFEVTGSMENVELARKEIESYIALRTGQNAGDDELTTPTGESGDILLPLSGRLYSAPLSGRADSIVPVSPTLPFHHIRGSPDSGADQFGTSLESAVDTLSRPPATAWSDYGQRRTMPDFSQFGVSDSLASQLQSARKVHSLHTPRPRPKPSQALHPPSAAQQQQQQQQQQHRPLSHSVSDPFSARSPGQQQPGSGYGSGYGRDFGPIGSPPLSSSSASNGSLSSGSGPNSLNSKRRGSTTSSTDSAISLKECAICYSGELDAALVPCGHNLFCMECAHRIQEERKTCPACHTAVTSVLRIRQQ